MDALLFTPLLGVDAWLWLLFLGIVVVLLALDLGVLHRKEREIGIAESLALSAGYIAVALAFGTWIWQSQGRESGLAWMTGYMVEKTLSLDNVFVISLIFASLAIPRAYQHRVLFWGILGVIVLRGIMIGFGTALVSNFAWVLYLFGAFLVFTGLKMLVVKSDGHADPTHGPVMGWLRRRLNVSPALAGNRFLPATRTNGGRRPCFWPWFWWKWPIWCSPSIACRPSSPSPPIPIWFTPRTSSPFSVCGRFTSPWPPWCIASPI